MKAVRVHSFNQALRVDEVPEPTAAGDEQLVEMRYAAVNPLDIWVSQGRASGKLPMIVGVEGVGTLDGQAVLVNGAGLGTARDGTYAEHVVAPPNALTKLSSNAALKQAAAMGVAGVTAWNVVHELAKVSSGDRVLVLGASGGVGSVVVQVAKNTGATVWGQTSASEKADILKEAGADNVVVAADSELAEKVKDFQPTVVIDPLGNGFTGAAIEAMAAGGRLVIFGASAGPVGEISLRAFYGKGLTMMGYVGLSLSDEVRTAALDKVLAELAAGRIRVHIDDILPLDQAAEAHRRILGRQVRGKLLLTI